MFPLMNTVAVRSVLHGTLKEMLRYKQDMSDTTRRYQHFPLGTARTYALASRLEGTSQNTTLFDTLFIYQGRRAPRQTQPLYQSVYGSAEVEFSVCVEMEIMDDNLVWTAACKPEAGNEANGIIGLLDRVLTRLLAHPDSDTFLSDAQGTSICGLPKFKKLDDSKIVSHEK
jgi:hypothetical protein